MKKQRIRVLALCIFYYKGRILVFEGMDNSKQQPFYRPLGGAVEFGETLDQAMLREIHEELGEEITDLEQLGVLENIFTYEGAPGHEIAFIFNARFKNMNVYLKENLKASENDGILLKLCWLKVKELSNLPIPLYPNGITQLILDQNF